MHKLKSIIWIRPIALVILVVSGFLFAESYFIGNYLQKITGTKAGGRLSPMTLFKGEIGLKNVLIYSPDKYYGGIKAVYIRNMTIRPCWKSLFSKQKCIENVIIDGVVINNIYNNAGENNIKEILIHSAEYYQNSKPEGRSRIKHFSLKNVFLNTSYKNNGPISSRLPDISINDVKNKHGIINTIGEAVTLSLNTSLNKNDGRSFWQKAGDAVDTGLNITSNILNVGSMVLGTTYPRASLFRRDICSF